MIASTSYRCPTQTTWLHSGTCLSTATAGGDNIGWALFIVLLSARCRHVLKQALTLFTMLGDPSDSLLFPAAYKQTADRMLNTNERLSPEEMVAALTQVVSNWKVQEVCGIHTSASSLADMDDASQNILGAIPLICSFGSNSHHSTAAVYTLYVSTTTSTWIAP